jgi:hypothetical protein
MTLGELRKATVKMPDSTPVLLKIGSQTATNARLVIHKAIKLDNETYELFRGLIHAVVLD